MGEQIIENSNEKDRRKKILIIVGILLLLLIAILLFLFLPKNLKAIEIRIQRLVGVVNLYDSKGKDISLLERMKLNSGQTLTTADESLVMLSLDETKLVTLEAESKAMINTSGKALEFELAEGNLFFNVTEKLSDDSSYDIRTSNMLCGIRGTSGYVGEDATGHDILMVCDGEVFVTGINPVTKEETQASVPARSMVTVYLDEEAEGDKTVSFRTGEFREEDLPPLALDAIRKDEELQDRITEATGFSKEKLVELAKVTSKAGKSMFGEAVAELEEAGIEDAIPLMGFPAREITIVANKAADTAEDDLALEIAIIKGLGDVLDAGLEGGCDEEELHKIMEDSADKVCETLIRAKKLGLTGEDLMEVSDSMTGTYAYALTEMKGTDLTKEEVYAVVEAIGIVYDNAMDRAEIDGIDVLSSIHGASDHITTTVHNEMEKLASGDETVIALLGQGSKEEDTSKPSADTTGNTEGEETDTEGTDTADAGNGNGNDNNNDNGNNNGRTVNRAFVPGLLEPGIEPDVSEYVDKIDPLTGKLTLTDGTIFDPVYYAAANPDAYNKYGYNTNDLLYDYLHRKSSGETLYASAEDKKAAEEKAYQEFAKMIEDEMKAQQEAETLVASAEPESSSGGGGGGGGNSYSYDPQTGEVTLNGNRVGSVSNGNLTLYQSGNYSLPINLGGTDYSISNGNVDTANAPAGTVFTDTSLRNRDACDRVYQATDLITINTANTSISGNNSAQGTRSLSGSASDIDGLYDVYGDNHPGTYTFGNVTMNNDGSSGTSFTYNGTTYYSTPSTLGMSHSQGGTMDGSHFRESRDPNAPNYNPEYNISIDPNGTLTAT